MAIRVIRFLAQLKEVIANGGRVPMSFLASGTPTGSKFIRDDGTLATPSGGGSSAGTVGQVQCAGVTAGTFAVAASNSPTINQTTGVITAVAIGSSGGGYWELAQRGLQMYYGVALIWSLGGSGGTADTNISQLGAGSLAFGNGTVGDTSAKISVGRVLIDGATDDGVTALQVGGNGNIAATGLNCSSVFASSYLQSAALLITGALADGTYPIASGAGSCTIGNGVITAIS